MSLSELLEQLARIFPYILKQSLILREILCDTRGFFGRLNASEDGALRDALIFVIFLIVIDSLIHLPIDSLVWQIDPLSPHIFMASASLSSLSVSTVVLSAYIASALVFKVDSMPSCTLLGCYIYSFFIVLHIGDYPMKFIVPREVLERMLDIELNQFEIWIQSLSYKDLARFAVVLALTLIINVVVFAKLTLALSAYRRLPYPRAFLAMGLLITVQFLLHATVVWPIFIGVVRFSR